MKSFLGGIMFGIVDTLFFFDPTQWHEPVKMMLFRSLVIGLAAWALLP